VLGSQYYR